MSFQILSKTQSLAFWNNKGIYYPYVSQEDIDFVVNISIEEGLIASLPFALEDRTLLGLLYVWFKKFGLEIIIDYQKLAEYSSCIPLSHQICLGFILSSVDKSSLIEENFKNKIRRTKFKKITSNIIHFFNNHLPVFLPFRSFFRRVLVEYEVDYNSSFLGRYAGEKLARGSLFASLDPYFAEYGCFVAYIARSNNRKIIDNSLNHKIN